MAHNKQDLTRSTIQGTLWAYVSRYSGKLLNFVSITILARLLVQEDFGVAGYALVVIGFLEVTGLGIGPALIYHDQNSKRTNTGFWLAIITGLALLGLMWLLAPLAGWFFQDPRAVPVVRVLALVFPISSLAVVPEALLFKELAFNRKFVPDLVKAISKGLVAISLAWLGYGAWSLIFGQLVGTAMAVVAFWLVMPSRWRPSFRFDTRLARPLLSYGANIAAVFVLGVLLLNVDYLLVGRYLGAAALGVYTLAFRVPELLIKQFYGELGNVLFPIYTQMRHDVAALRQSFLTTMRYVTLVTVPLGLGLALVAKPLVLTIFGDKWVDAIPVMSAIAIYMMIRSVYDNSGSVYKAQGHPDLLSKLNLLHLTITAPALWWAIVQYGTLTAVAWTQVLVVLLVGSFRLIAAARMVNTPLRVIFSTLRPVIFGGTIMSLSVFAVLQLTVDTLPVIQLGVSVSTGILTYCIVMWWLQRDMVLVAGHKLRAALTGR